MEHYDPERAAGYYSIGLLTSLVFHEALRHFQQLS